MLVTVNNLVSRRIYAQEVVPGVNLFGSKRRSEQRAAQAEAYAGRLPAGQHIVTNWPVLTYGPTPEIAPGSWQISVYGLVAEEKTFTYDQFRDLGYTTFHADFHCVTRFSMMDNDWSGIPVRRLMEQVEVLPEAKAVMVHCYGGYTTNLLIDDFNRDENIFAFERNGGAIDRQHGYPVRLIVPHLYAWKSAKWVTAIQFIDRDRPGFWEINGYHMRGEPFAEERFG